MKKRLMLNTVSAFLATIVSTICGFILPRQILVFYGSEVNGVISSIAQFLSIIGFLELGMGAVVQSSLYKPLAENDSVKISQIMVSATKFFRLVGLLIFIYVCILIPLYPVISRNKFGGAYTAIFIVAMSVNSLAQYYFGISCILLLSAHQKGYIHTTIQCITLIINTSACIVLMNYGASIQMVKLTTSLIYLIRPVAVYWYVQKNYHIDYKVHYDTEPIEQKWNGVAQHLAVVIMDGIDIIVLTAFSTLQNVSIYTVYQLVLRGIKELAMSMSKGILPIMGELWAKKDIERLNKFFNQIEWIAHTGCVFVFGNAAVLIVPFVQVYTKGIVDVSYSEPVFAVLLTAAFALCCLRTPYNLMIQAGGKYKKTQGCYIMATVINIVISVMSVRAWGLVGVAIGTVAAMAYQIIWQVVYIAHNLTMRPAKIFWKQTALDILTSLLGFMCTYKLKLSNISYFSWSLLAVKTAIIWLIIVIVINSVFCKGQTTGISRLIKKSKYNSKGDRL